MVVGNPNKPKNTTTYKEAHTPKKIPKKENDKMYNLIKQKNTMPHKINSEF